MKIIKLSFDYGTSPIWVYDENGDMETNGLPEELLADSELVKSFDNLQNAYENLFINNKDVFCYRGFRNVKEKEAFKSLLTTAPAMLINKTTGKFEIKNNLEKIDYFESLHDPAYENWLKLKTKQKSLKKR